MQGKILTHAFAQGIYQTMIALNDNDIDASYCFTFTHANGDEITVYEDPDSWAVTVALMSTSTERYTEHYENQAAFALAYGISA